MKFIDQVMAAKVSPTEEYYIKDRMTGWNKIAEMIYDDKISEDFLLFMIRVEIATSKREVVLDRLYTRYCTLRKIREREELCGIREKN